MAIRNYKPTTPGRRKMSALINEEITTSTPEKSLTVTIKKNGGRNNQGKITVRHQGGALLCRCVSAAAAAHPVVFQTLCRCGDAIYIRTFGAVSQCGRIRDVRPGGHLRCIHRRTDTQQVHPQAVTADEPHRVHRQRALHSIFPYRCRNAHQHTRAVRRTRYIVGSAVHGSGRHAEQGHSSIRVVHIVQEAAAVGTHDVRTDRGPRRRRNSHDNGGHAPEDGRRQLSRRRQHAQRCGDDDSVHVHHQLCRGGELGTQDSAAREDAARRDGKDGRRRENTAAAATCRGCRLAGTSGNTDKQQETEPRADRSERGLRQYLQRAQPQRRTETAGTCRGCGRVGRRADADTEPSGHKHSQRHKARFQRKRRLRDNHGTAPAYRSRRQFLGSIYARTHHRHQPTDNDMPYYPTFGHTKTHSCGSAVAGGVRGWVLSVDRTTVEAGIQSGMPNDISRAERNHDAHKRIYTEPPSRRACRIRTDATLEKHHATRDTDQQRPSARSNHGPSRHCVIQARFRKSARRTDCMFPVMQSDDCISRPERTASGCHDIHGTTTSGTTGKRIFVNNEVDKQQERQGMKRQ